MNKRPADSILRHTDFVLLDLISLQAAFLAAYFVSSGEGGSPYAHPNHVFLLIVMTVCQLITILFSNNYEIIIRRGPYEEMVQIMRFTTMMGMLVLVVLFVLQKTSYISRLQAGWTIIFYIALDWIARFLNKKRIYRHNREGRKRAYSMLVITKYSMAESIIQTLTAPDVRRNYFITGVMLTDGGADVSGIGGVKVMRPGEDTMRLIRRGWVDDVLYFQPDGEEADYELLNSFVDMGISVHICPEFLNSKRLPVSEIEELGDYTVLTSRLRFVSLDQVIIKRAMDIAGGIIGCIITLILTVIIGPIIYFESPGPIFFSQERIGRGGHKFRMYKFRSMYPDAEKRKAELLSKNSIEDGMMFKLDNDPRIIGSDRVKKNGRPGGIGNFIRNTSIDEFPQFFNVLKGDMSMVGTRPPLPEEWEKYDNHHRARMTVKPGITGLWQISGRSDITDFEEVIKLDLEYIETWTIKLDIKIILKTIGVIFSGSGAK